MSESISAADAVDQLLNQGLAPQEEASEEVEAVAEAEEAEAPETEVEEVEAVEEDQAETDEIDEEDEDEAETEEVEVDVYTVKVDGEEQEATLDDLIENYQLKQASHKRLQEAAEERKALEAERASFKDTEAQYEQAVKQITEFLSGQTSTKTPEYWQELYDSDPIAYVRERDLEQENQRRLQLAEAEQERLNAEKVAKANKEILERVPHWKDQEVAIKEIGEMNKYAETYAFTAADLGVMRTDSRLIDLMRKAMLYDRLQEKKPIARKKVAKATKMVKSGQPKSAKATAKGRQTKAYDNFKGNASIASAVDYLMTKKG